MNSNSKSRVWGAFCCTFFLTVLTLGCKGGSSSSNSGGQNPPPEFDNSNLSGDWFGSLVGESGTESATFYIRCGENGFPFAGADARLHDWTLMDATTFSWVRPRGQVFISVITGTELLFLDGSFDLTGTVVLGDFVKVIDGNEVGRGSFEAYQSPGPGTFVLEQLLPGYWSGNIVDAGGNKHPLEWTVDEFGRVTEGSFSGSAMDFSAWPGGLPLGFELDSVGRLHGISIPNQAGDWIQLDYLLVNEAGQFLGGPVGSTALGTGILQMEHAPG